MERVKKGHIIIDIIDDAIDSKLLSKDKLDLGLITQTQYDSLKSVMIKYIK